MLRFVTPVMNFRRTAMSDTELSGTKIRQGDKVVFYHSSANRDEDVFENPGSFDVGRDPNPHIAFGGGGPHFCLGANLARMEIRIMFEHLLDRLPDIHQAGACGALAVAVHQRREAPPGGLHPHGSAGPSGGSTAVGGAFPGLHHHDGE